MEAKSNSCCFKRTISAPASPQHEGLTGPPGLMGGGEEGGADGGRRREEGGRQTWPAR